MRVFTLGPAAEPGTEQAAGKETAEEVILQRLLRQMKLPVFALEAFCRYQPFISHSAAAGEHLRISQSDKILQIF